MPEFLNNAQYNFQTTGCTIVALPHLSEELEAMNATEYVVVERENLGKHIRGDLEQLGWSKDEQSSSALSLIRLRFRSHSLAHRSFSLSLFN